jgi:hypothetical protein
MAKLWGTTGRREGEFPNYMCHASILRLLAGCDQLISGLTPYQQRGTETQPPKHPQRNRGDPTQRENTYIDQHVKILSKDHQWHGNSKMMPTSSTEHKEVEMQRKPRKKVNTKRRKIWNRTKQEKRISFIRIEKSSFSRWRKKQQG